MEVLMTKVADMLQITVEKAIEIYPIFRGQFVAMKVLDTVWMLFMVLFVISLAVLLTTMLVLGNDDDNEEGDAKATAKVFGVATIILLLLMVVSSLLKYVLAPDYMLWMSMLGK